MAFVHLRTHSEFSVVDGTLRIDDVAAAAKDDGQLALGVTDLSNLFGAIKFYKTCRGQGVKPIIGVDVWMDADDMNRYYELGLGFDLLGPVFAGQPDTSTWQASPGGWVEW